MRRWLAAALAIALVGSAGGAAAQTAGTVAFVRVGDGAAQLETVEADGSGARELVRGVGVADPAWSPDGTRVALSVSGGLAVLSVDSGALEPLPGGRGGADPSWSPEGGRIAFTRTVRGNQDVYAVRLADGALTRLTSARARDQEPAWSPDGSTIAFSSRRAGGWDVWAMDADGGRERRLTRMGAAEGMPAWSPDGSALGFWRRTAEGVRLHVLERGRVRALTGGPGNDYDVAWSPDGARIAFVSDRSGRPRVYVAFADGSGAAPIGTMGGFPSAPAWRPPLR